MREGGSDGGREREGGSEGGMEGGREGDVRTKPKLTVNLMSLISSWIEVNSD